MKESERQRPPGLRFVECCAFCEYYVNDCCTQYEYEVSSYHVCDNFREGL